MAETRRNLPFLNKTLLPLRADFIAFSRLVPGKLLSNAPMGCRLGGNTNA